MDIKKILNFLEQESNPSRRSAYLNAGAPNETYGVPIGKMRTLAKTLGSNNQDALRLWETNITDAQLLATMILNPKTLKVKDAYRLVDTAVFDQVLDELVFKVLVKSTCKNEMMDQYQGSNKDRELRVYWAFIVDKVSKDKHIMSEEINSYLQEIEIKLRDAMPQTQWMMNRALAEIGFRHLEYTSSCLEIGERLGVYKDMKVAPGCTSAYAPAWINAVLKRK